MLPVVAAEKVNKTKNPKTWEKIYVRSFCLSHLALVTLLGIVLNVGFGMLAPLCLFLAFWKRQLMGNINSNSNREYQLVDSDRNEEGIEDSNSNREYQLEDLDQNGEGIQA